MRPTLFIALLTLAFLPLPTRAAAQPFTRFVDAQTLAVARLDLTHYDPAALRQWALDTLKSTHPNQSTVDFATRLLDESGLLSAPARLKQAGATEIDLVFSPANLPYAPAVLLVPLPDNTAPERLATALLGDGTKPLPNSPANSPRFRSPDNRIAGVIDHSLVLTGSPYVDRSPPLDRLQSLTPTPRPDLTNLLSQSPPNTPFTLALSPSDDARKVIEQMFPQLPAPISTPSTVLTRGLRTALLTLSLPPQPKLSLTIQSASPADAQNLHTLLTRLSDFARQQPQARRAVPDIDHLLPQLIPAAQADHLTLTLDTPAVTQLATALTPATLAAYHKTLLVQSLSNLKQIGMALILYANEHKGSYPDTLDQIASQLSSKADFDRVTTNPLQPTRHPGYTYIKPPTDTTHTPPDRLLAYETFDQWPGRIGALFADGHCQILSSQDEFTHLLTEAKTPPAPRQQ